MEAKNSNVYLLHFEKPLHHAKHYVGCTKDVEKRLERHRKAPTPKIMQALKKKGIDFRLARVWKGKGKHFERRIKNRKEAPALCPICNPSKAMLKANY